MEIRPFSDSNSSQFLTYDKKYNLSVMVGDKISEEGLYSIESGEHINFFNVGEVIDIRNGRTPGFADLDDSLKGVNRFEVTGIEKSIMQFDDTKQIIFYTRVFTTPIIEK